MRKNYSVIWRSIPFKLSNPKVKVCIVNWKVSHLKHLFSAKKQLLFTLGDLPTKFLSPPCVQLWFPALILIPFPQVLSDLSMWKSSGGHLKTRSFSQRNIKSEQRGTNFGASKNLNYAPCPLTIFQFIKFQDIAFCFTSGNVERQ